MQTTNGARLSAPQKPRRKLVHSKNSPTLSKECMHVQPLSHSRLFVTPQTVACQAPLSMEFFRQDYWSGLPFPAPGDLPDPEIEPMSLPSSALAEGSNPGLPHCRQILYQLSHQGSPRILGWVIPSPTDLSDPGIEPGSPALQVDSLPLSHRGSREYCSHYFICQRLLNNMALNCMGPLIGGLFSTVNTIVLHDPRFVRSVDVEEPSMLQSRGYGQLMRS